jgi:hypothetical protein
VDLKHVFISKGMDESKSERGKNLADNESKFVDWQQKAPGLE